MVKISGVLVTAIFLALPSQAFAWGESEQGHREGARTFVRTPQVLAWGERGRDHREESPHYPVYGRFVFGLPGGFFSISLGGARYYYGDGVFYCHRGFGYVVVAPPVGVVIPTIPAGYQSVMINGVSYYTADGIYYQYTPQGYLVANPPSVAMVTTPPVVASAPAVTVTPNETTDVLTVNIPNERGGYTAVTLKRSGNGFIGPQSEYYSEFPRVNQLRAIYGK